MQIFILFMKADLVSIWLPCFHCRMNIQFFFCDSNNAFLIINLCSRINFANHSQFGSKAAKSLAMKVDFFLLRKVETFQLKPEVNIFVDSR